MRRAGFVLLVMVMVSAGLAGQQPAPKNLQVLPKDLPRQQVVQIMRQFTQGLGVRCQHCHVGEGNDLSQFDFASDAKPTKVTARKMLAMVLEINNKTLAGIGEPTVNGAPKVTCYTCHRGALKPLTAPPPAAGGGGDALRPIKSH